MKKIPVGSRVRHKNKKIGEGVIVEWKTQFPLIKWDTHKVKKRKTKKLGLDMSHVNPASLRKI